MTKSDYNRSKCVDVVLLRRILYRNRTPKFRANRPIESLFNTDTDWMNRVGMQQNIEWLMSNIFSLLFLQGTETDDSGNVMFLTNGWSVKNDVLDNIVTNLRDKMEANQATRGPWDQYLDEGKIWKYKPKKNEYNFPLRDCYRDWKVCVLFTSRRIIESNNETNGVFLKPNGNSVNSAILTKSV